MLPAGRASEEFAKPMFDRCLTIVTQQLAVVLLTALTGSDVDTTQRQCF